MEKSVLLTQEKFQKILQDLFFYVGNSESINIKELVEEIKEQICSNENKIKI